MHNRKRTDTQSRMKRALPLLLWRWRGAVSRWRPRASGVECGQPGRARALAASSPALEPGRARWGQEEAVTAWAELGAGAIADPHVRSRVCSSLRLRAQALSSPPRPETVPPGQATGRGGPAWPTAIRPLRPSPPHTVKGDSGSSRPGHADRHQRNSTRTDEGNERRVGGSAAGRVVLHFHAASMRALVGPPMSLRSRHGFRSGLPAAGRPPPRGCRCRRRAWRAVSGSVCGAVPYGAAHPQDTP